MRCLSIRRKRFWFLPGYILIYSYGFPLGEKKGNEIQQVIKNDEFLNARK